MKKAYIGFKARNMGYDAHLTVIFMGDITEGVAELTRQILANMIDLEYKVEREKIRLFGYGNIPVVVVKRNDALHLLRDHLIDLGVKSKNDYEWTPHITLKLDNDNPIIIPKVIQLSQLNLYGKPD